MHISCGVPQESILGPQLFMIYVNDMCKVSDILKFILFADDTNIFYSHSCLTHLVEVLCTELNKLHTWFNVNKLSLNIDETNYILFGRYATRRDVTLHINTVEMKRVQCTKFLSLIINESLNWKNHINVVKSKLGKVSSVLYKVSHCVNRCSLHTLYCSLFLPNLMY